ncbi:sodium/hydrogen exchanger [Desulfovibrio sp. X2]|uniref:cation:proton antiporter domain-containing protein n=1 Tax=Desulfovibrio sp. X2 TaxID=941449 RepID=UPI0003588A32|nr:cation:proton antiporter [Desulfovibrio sp. X2]EPR44668.1 sodium/hydrogen exchanger [Desulfovibrio sp. X2]
MDVLGQLVLLICAAAAVVFACRMARVPTGVGYLLAGILCGPHGLALIRDPHSIELLAELGVVLLLFTIGLEFSVKRLATIKRLALGGGTVQMLATAALGIVVLLVLWPNLLLRQDVFIAFLASLSSTAVVLKLLKDRGEADLPHGNAALGILIFQDIAVVPLMLLTPILAGTGGGGFLGVAEDLLLLLAKAGLLVGLTLLLTQRLAPAVLTRVARTRDRELFLMAVAALCLGVAFLSWKLGMSLALGAFLAGLVIAESDYGHQAVAVVMPFHDLFMSFFFISVGMLLDLHFMAANIGIVLLTALLLSAGKSLTGTAAGLAAGLGLPAALLTGLSLFQVGEFSFILAQGGVAAGLLPVEAYQIFLAAAVLTMIATPFVMSAGVRMARALRRTRLPGLLAGHGLATPPEGTERLQGHLIIVGFGPGGRQMAQAAELWRLPYVVVEGNPDTVRAEREAGRPIFFGDATSEHILEHAGVTRARAVAVTISDPAACRGIVFAVRDLAPEVLIVARTPYLGDVAELRRLGADEVVAAEYEASAEVLARVLAAFLVPEEEISSFIKEVRAEGYEMLRKTVGPDGNERAGHVELYLPGVRTLRLTVARGSAADGRSLADLSLRKRLQVTVLAMRRDGEVLMPPPPARPLAPGDVLLLVGATGAVNEARGLFCASDRTCEAAEATAP